MFALKKTTSKQVNCIWTGRWQDLWWPVVPMGFLLLSQGQLQGRHLLPHWKNPLSLMTAEHSSVLKLPTWVKRYYPSTASPATVQGQSCKSNTCSSPRMTIPCALFAALALHLVTCILRQVKRWPNFCKVLSMEIPREGNEPFWRASLSFGSVSTGG